MIIYAHSMREDWQEYHCIYGYSEKEWVVADKFGDQCSSQPENISSGGETLVV